MGNIFGAIYQCEIFSYDVSIHSPILTVGVEVGRQDSGKWQDYLERKCSGNFPCNKNNQYAQHGGHLQLTFLILVFPRPSAMLKAEKTLGTRLGHPCYGQLTTSYLLTSNT